LRFDYNVEMQDQQTFPQGQTSLNFDMNDEFEPRDYYNKINADDRSLSQVSEEHSQDKEATTSSTEDNSNTF